MTEAVSAALLVCAGVSSAVGVTLAGYLFESFGHMSIIYFATTAACINTVVYVAILVFRKLVGRWQNQERKGES